MYNDQFCGPEPFKLVLLMFSFDILLKSLQNMICNKMMIKSVFKTIQPVLQRCIIVAVTLSRILKAKQKLDVTFNSNKLGIIDYTKFSKLTTCSA